MASFVATTTLPSPELSAARMVISLRPKRIFVSVCFCSRSRHRFIPRPMRPSMTCGASWELPMWFAYLEVLSRSPIIMQRRLAATRMVCHACRRRALSRNALIRFSREQFSEGQEQQQTWLAKLRFFGILGYRGLSSSRSRALVSWQSSGSTGCGNSDGPTGSHTVAG